ncbi:MAG: microcystin degradation protein MlrC [Paracoccaceae bacterium]|jgi:microcystin degradation protein MlrC
MMGFRVAIIEFSHESNTFTVNATGLHAFHVSRYLRGPEMFERLRDTGSEIAGALDVGETHGWETVPIVAAHANPGGPVTEVARREITETATRLLGDGAPYDGVFIALHGAMVTETDQDGESQFLRAIRAVVGADTPIAVTLDLHGNIFDAFADLVDIVVSYRSYPHVDMRARAVEACNLLHQTMAGGINPHVVIARPPMLVGCDDGRTTNAGPMCRILDHAAREMDQPGILNVAVNAGFTDADVFAAGPSVLVTYDGEFQAQARAAATRICDTIWGFRDDWTKPISLADGIKALTSRPDNDNHNHKPVIVADYSDNPGSGAYGDCTALLSALLAAGVQNAALGALCDPEAASALMKAGQGATVTLAIGGKTDARVGGGPITVTGKVMAVSDGDIRFEGPMSKGVPASLGPSVCFHVQGIDVLISSESVQMYDQSLFHCVGIEPAQKSVVVVKSMQHFRAAFEPIAGQVLVVDAGGLCSPDVTLRDYTHLRRPVFPLDDVNV